MSTDYDPHAHAQHVAAAPAAGSGCISLHDLRARSHIDRIAKELVDVPGIGRFCVRGVTMAEVLDAGKYAERVVDPHTGRRETDTKAQQHFLLVRAIVEPKLSLADVDMFDTWTAGQTHALITAVNRLSGLGSPVGGEKAVPFSSAPGNV